MDERRRPFVIHLGLLEQTIFCGPHFYGSGHGAGSGAGPRGPAGPQGNPGPPGPPGKDGARAKMA